MVSGTLIFVSLKFFLTYVQCQEVNISTFDYCTITCNGKKHTMCEYPEGGPSQCSSFKRGLTPTMKRTLLEIHNDLRQQVATGDGINGEPKAANMAALSWSDEAAMIAQRWADQCTEASKEDECRTSIEHQPGGQNLINTYTNQEIDLYFFQKNAVLHWFNTGNKFNKNLLKSYSFNADSASYSQIVWAETLSLGCGLSNGVLNDTNVWRLVCNYYPAGNVKGKSVYVEGIPCTECPRSCDKPNWPALCTPSKETVHNWEKSTAPTRTLAARPSHCVVSVALVVIRSFLGRCGLEYSY